MAIVILLFAVPKPIWNATWTDILKKDLLMTYDKYSRPTNHYNTTQVNVSLAIVHIDIDERKSILTTMGWFRMVRDDNCNGNNNM